MLNQLILTDEFLEWVDNLSDLRARARIQARVKRLATGNPGDVRPVGSGVSEMRIHFGPGYRVYFTRRDESVLLVIAGGDKDSQSRDIEKAIRIAKDF